MRMTAGIAIRSSIAPIADRASPSFATSLTTGQAHRCCVSHVSACLAEYENPLDRRFHASRMPAGSADRAWNSGSVRAQPLMRRSYRGSRCPTPRRIGRGRQRVGRISSGGRRHELHRNRPLAPTKATGREALCRVGSDLQTAEELCQLEDAGRSVLQSIQRPIVLLPKRLRA